MAQTDQSQAASAPIGGLFDAAGYGAIRQWPATGESVRRAAGKALPPKTVLEKFLIFMIHGKADKWNIQ